MLFGVFVITSSKAFLTFDCTSFAEDDLVLYGNEQFAGPLDECFL